MTAIIDLWDYELERNNAGAFGMQYIVAHPSARMPSKHILKTTALFQQIMGFMANDDGLSEAEILLLCENQHLLCNYSFTSQVARNNLQSGALFTAQQLDDAIAAYMEKCEAGEDKRHFISNLYMMLCVAGSDGLSKGKISRYHQIAQKMGFDKVMADKILQTYFKECELISSFNDIYNL